MFARATASFPDISVDTQFLLRAAQLADSSAGCTAPHPNSACVIARGPAVVAEAFLYGQGTVSAEVQACHKAGGDARGATAYLNLEPGDCHGDDGGVLALKEVSGSSCFKVLLFQLGNVHEQNDTPYIYHMVSSIAARVAVLPPCIVFNLVMYKLS